MSANAHFDGTGARQLDFKQFEQVPSPRPLKAGAGAGRSGSSLRLLHKDIYAELTRRRRRAQIAARKWVG